MRKLILICALFTTIAVYGQTVTGSSLNFGTSSTSKCMDPTAGQTIVCGTPNAVTVSFNGATPVTLPAQGTPGAAATITVGTVTAGTAGSTPKVTNSGTSSAAVFNFTIPIGATGPAGPTGATGPAGPAGTTTLSNASCTLKFTGAPTTDGSVAVVINCQ